MLSHMAKYATAEVDGVFAALADPTRRAVVRRLGTGPASVSELAGAFPITLPSFLKHVRALETCGLIHTSKAGRVRTCALDRGRLALVEGWLDEQRRVWADRTDRLEGFIADEMEEHPWTPSST